MGIKHWLGSLRQPGNIGRLLWGGALTLNALVIGIATLVIVQERQREEEQAQVLTENYSRILEEDLVGFINKIDITLLTVRDEVVQQMARGPIDTQAMESFLARQDTHIPEALGLRVVDRAGIIRYAVNDVKVRNASIADRPQFIRLRDDPSAGLVFSAPVMGRAAQKWIITLSRRVDGSDGKFAGDVHVAVGVQHFIDIFAALNLGERGNIGLWDPHQLVARYSRADPRGSSTGAATPSPELRELLGSGRKAAAYHARSGVDGVMRSYFFRQVGNYPLYLVVGLADEDYLADWRSNAEKVGALAALFVLVTLVATMLVRRLWEQQQRNHAAMMAQKSSYTAELEKSRAMAEAARQRSELLLSSAGEGICGVDPEGKVTFINPTARQLLGWSERESIGQDLHSTTHHHRPDGSPYERCDCPIHKTLQDGQARQEKEDVYWRKDGSSFSVEYTVTALWQDGCISGAVNVFRDITQRKELEERITYLALYDDLTGLPNRAYLYDALERMGASARRHQEAVGILYVDLDGFKPINDTLGHAAGDGVLREVAARLRGCVRTEDVISRLGGDEFLILTQVPPDDAALACRTLAQRILDALHPAIPLPQGLARVTCSIGVAIYPLCSEAIESCIQKADMAMYAAKNLGKNRYALASDGDGVPPPSLVDTAG